MRLPIGPPTIAWLLALGLTVAVLSVLAIRARRPIWALGAIAAGSEIIYLLVFTGAYPLTTFFPRTTDFGEIEGLSGAAFWGYCLAQALLFSGLAAAVWICGRVASRIALPLVFGAGAVFGLTLIPLYPFTAIDVFYYVILARVWGIHGANPFVVPASAFPEDSFLQLGVQWVDFPSLYGPVWTYLSLPAAWLAARDFLAGVFYFKLLALAALLASGWLILRIAGAERRPGGIAAAAFWLWNPLVLHEGIGEGHNDIVLAALLLLAVYLAGRRPVAAAAGLAAATLIKVTALPLLPLLLRGSFWDQPPLGRWTGRVGAVGLIGLGWILAYLPFWAGRETFAFLDRLDFFAQSTPALAALWIREWRLSADPQALVKYATILIFALVYLWLLRRPIADRAELAARWFEVLFWYFVIALAYYHNWYLIPLVGLAAANGRIWQRARIWTMGLAGQIGLATSYFVWRWSGWDYLEAYTLTVPIYFVPALLVTAAGFAYDLRRHRGATGLLSAPPAGHVAAPPIDQ